MDKLISQQAAIDEAEKWFFNLKDKRSPGEVLNDLPSVQLSGIDDEQELISKEQAIDKIKERLFETAFNNVGIKQNIDETLVDVAENRLEIWFNELPSIQPDTTTHDSIPAETGENDGDRTNGDCCRRCGRRLIDG